MRPALHYPDLVPPPGWTYRPEGSQIRLSPPAGTPPAAILLSPLVARHERLPPPERLIDMALAVEEETRFTVRARSAAKAFRAQRGLSGVSVEVTGYVRPSEPLERRIYVLLADDRCYYGINYLAPESSHEAHLGAFWAAVDSLRPFEGEVLLPPPAAGEGASPMSNYED